MAYRSGRHFLQIPGPTNVPERILRAISAPTIDHRGPEFAALARQVLAGAARLCGTSGPVALYPSSGTGAWEAALVNTLSPSDRVLAFETGHFATLWSRMAGQLGLDIELVPGDWRHGVDPGQVHERLSADHGHAIKAVTVVHNETSTGTANRIPLIRAPLGGGAGAAVAAGPRRLGEPPRRAVRGWGLDIACLTPDESSSTLTAVIVPDGHNADDLRRLILDRYNMSLGAGLGRLAGRVFRIGHLGALGDLELAGALCGVEMGLTRAGVPISRDGVPAALGYLSAQG